MIRVAPPNLDQTRITWITQTMAPVFGRLEVNRGRGVDMTDTLEKLQQKFNPPGACGPGEETYTDRRAVGTEMEPKGWRSVPEIMILREYLDAHPELGARVGLCGETGLSMRFNPPIGTEHGKERMDAAFEAAVLHRFLPPSWAVDRD